MVKILIADDHAVVREGLKQILSESSEMVVTAEASTGPEVLEKIGKDDFDLVVLDISMPGRGGLDILKEIKNKKPRLPVLILSMYPEEQYAVRVLKAGASGYMTKESAPHELVKAIQQISKGKKYVSPSLAEKLALDLEITTGRPLHESLSDREYQVMCMIASGKTLKEIAEQLSLSIKTISTYRSRILEKMNMKSNAELTHHAIKNRLVD
jgi:DNA-binding NarL/FixJ family response regulator